MIYSYKRLTWEGLEALPELKNMDRIEGGVENFSGRSAGELLDAVTRQ